MLDGLRCCRGICCRWNWNGEKVDGLVLDGVGCVGHVVIGVLWPLSCVFGSLALGWSCSLLAKKAPFRFFAKSLKPLSFRCFLSYKMFLDANRLSCLTRRTLAIGEQIFSNRWLNVGSWDKRLSLLGSRLDVMIQLLGNFCCVVVNMVETFWQNSSFETFSISFVPQWIINVLVVTLLNAKLFDWPLKRRVITKGSGFDFFCNNYSQSECFSVDQTEVFEERKHNRKIRRMY